MVEDKPVPALRRDINGFLFYDFNVRWCDLDHNDVHKLADTFTLPRDFNCVTTSRNQDQVADYFLSAKPSVIRISVFLEKHSRFKRPVQRYLWYMNGIAQSCTSPKQGKLKQKMDVVRSAGNVMPFPVSIKVSQLDLYNFVEFVLICWMTLSHNERIDPCIRQIVIDIAERYGKNADLFEGEWATSAKQRMNDMQILLLDLMVCAFRCVARNRRMNWYPQVPFLHREVFDEALRVLEAEETSVDDATVSSMSVESSPSKTEPPNPPCAVSWPMGFSTRGTDSELWDYIHKLMPLSADVYQEAVRVLENEQLDTQASRSNITPSSADVHHETTESMAVDHQASAPTQETVVYSIDARCMDLLYDDFCILLSIMKSDCLMDPHEKVKDFFSKRKTGDFAGFVEKYPQFKTVAQPYLRELVGSYIYAKDKVWSGKRVKEWLAHEPWMRGVTEYPIDIAIKDIDPQNLTAIIFRLGVRDCLSLMPVRQPHTKMQALVVFICGLGGVGRFSLAQDAEGTIRALKEYVDDSLLSLMILVLRDTATESHASLPDVLPLCVNVYNEAVRLIEQERACSSSQNNEPAHNKAESDKAPVDVPMIADQPKLKPYPRDICYKDIDVSERIRFRNFSNRVFAGFADHVYNMSEPVGALWSKHTNLPEPCAYFLIEFPRWRLIAESVLWARYSQIMTPTGITNMIHNPVEKVPFFDRVPRVPADAMLCDVDALTFVAFVDYAVPVGSDPARRLDNNARSAIDRAITHLTECPQYLISGEEMDEIQKLTKLTTCRFRDVLMEVILAGYHSTVERFARPTHLFVDVYASACEILEQQKELGFKISAEVVAPKSDGSDDADYYPADVKFHELPPPAQKIVLDMLKRDKLTGFDGLSLAGFFVLSEQNGLSTCVSHRVTREELVQLGTNFPKFALIVGTTLSMIDDLKKGESSSTSLSSADNKTVSDADAAENQPSTGNKDTRRIPAAVLFRELTKVDFQLLVTIFGFRKTKSIRDRFLAEQDSDDERSSKPRKRGRRDYTALHNCRQPVFKFFMGADVPPYKILRDIEQIEMYSVFREIVRLAIETGTEMNQHSVPSAPKSDLPAPKPWENVVPGVPVAPMPECVRNDRKSWQWNPRSKR